MVDALLGYSQRGAARASVAAILDWARGRAAVSLDTRDHPEAVGTLYLGDIGVPGHILTAAGAPGPDPFGSGPLVHVAVGEHS